MAHASSRLLVLAMLVLSVGLLLPGLFAPVLTIRGVLTRDGVAQVAPMMLDKGLNDETLNTLKSMMSPQMLAMLQFTGGDLKKVIMDRLTPQIIKSLQEGVDNVEVYTQTRSIVSAVRNLYDVGSPVPATLILLFSVIVPFAKGATVAWAVFVRDAAKRRRMVAFVVAIAKWSMADVFVVAVFIAYLAAQATQQPPGDPTAAPLLAFTAEFGPGFYWFASYCLFSLASQQYTARVITREARGSA
ncbi:MAG: paraquat-inducible protein A [Acidobacteriota bacterium]